MTVTKRKPGNQPGSVRVDPRKKKVRFSSRMQGDLLEEIRNHEKPLAQILHEAVEDWLALYS